MKNGCRMLAACAVGCVSVGLADSTNDVTSAELPAVVVLASRLGQSAKEIPSHVEVLTRPEIDASGAQSTVELLEKRANLFVRRMNANPALAQVSMRGYGANGFGRVKILVDGEELNNADMSAQNLLRVPIRSVRKVEILHGPQTILHGGNASAGVINIVTDGESAEPRGSVEIHGGNLGQVGVHADLSGGLADEGLYYFANFDFDRADGWRQNSRYATYSAKGGLKKTFANGSWASVKAFYADSRYGLPGGLYTGVYRSPYGTFDYGDWESRARTATDTESMAANDVYGLTAAFEGVLDEENSISGEFAFRDRKSTSYGYLGYDVYTFDYRLKYANETTLGGFQNRFDLGTDLKHDLLWGESYNPACGSGGGNDYQRFSGALFARDEFFVLEPLSVFGGVRGEGFHSADAYSGCFDTDPFTGSYRQTSGRSSQTQGDVAGEAGVNWRPVEEAKIFARWTRFYHQPLADELFSAYGIPNMSLRPESGHNVELGVDWTFLDEFNFTVTGYHTELDDEICYLNGGNRNAPDRTARDGFETSLTWSRDKVGSCGILYAYTYARFTEGEYRGCGVPLVPEQQLRLFGEYFLIDEVAVRAGYRFVGRQRYGGDFANEGGSMPHFGLFDIGARVMPTWKPLKGFTFAFAIDNLFDTRYFDYGEYFNPWYVYPGAGRSVTFSVRYEF